MILVSILTTTALVTFAHSMPLPYAMYKRREPILEQSKFMLLLDQREPDLVNQMFHSGNDPRLNAIRNKRVGSLSIVNSLDVLRERYMLELARRKALQDQRQIDENRRYLQSVGKRSIPDYTELYAALIDRTDDSEFYDLQQRKSDQDQDILSGKFRIPNKAQFWPNENSPELTRSQDEMQRLQGNEMQAL